MILYLRNVLYIDTVDRDIKQHMQYSTKAAIPQLRSVAISSVTLAFRNPACSVFVIKLFVLAQEPKCVFLMDQEAE
jgi:hypothetical protein